MYLIVLYSLHSTSVLSFYIDVVLTLSTTNVAHEIGNENTFNEEEVLNHIFKIYKKHASIVGIQEHININSPF